jgi:hypothetical protein
MTRRGAAAVAVALLAVAAVVALVAGGGSGEEEEGPPAPVVPVPRAEGVFNDPRVGVIARRPEGWDAGRRRGAVRLVSPDRTVIVAVSSPAPAAEYERVLDSAVAALRRQYGDAEVRAGDGRAIARRPTVSAVVSGTNARGTDVRVLVAAVRGQEEAFLVQVFAAEGASEQRLAEAQTVISTLQLRK